MLTMADYCELPRSIFCDVWLYSELVWALVMDRKSGNQLGYTPMLFIRNISTFWLTSPSWVVWHQGKNWFLYKPQVKLISSVGMGYTSQLHIPFVFFMCVVKDLKVITLCREGRTLKSDGINPVVANGLRAEWCGPLLPRFFGYAQKHEGREAAAVQSVFHFPSYLSISWQ